MTNKQQMRKGFPIVIWLPAVLGVVTAFISWWAIENYIELKVSERPRLPPLPVEELHVVVPRQTLTPGDTLSLDLLAARSLPAKALPDDVFFAEQVEELMGHVVTSEVRQGKPIQRLHLMAESTLVLRERIRSGYTAFTLPLVAEWTHGHSVQPGDTFDFYAVQSRGWEKLLSNIQLMDFVPQPSAAERAMGIQQRATHGIFEVPITAYAQLYTLQQQRLLVPVIQSIHSQGSPDRLALPKVTEIIHPDGVSAYSEEERR
ncbi:hypothetical protein CWE15_01640 [Aliidiomarina taiwanensis]|uniref:SAF domain-containing protein n=1 Tax=Aliidiomarina taiwanensis TaxID=946228 RepID=A0A432X929_9GAMM|nr:SAF domain-containing protein [Aliidiomarina taiwanensis]RUO43913.1 hypothetical protein CWE15_01640 [Aliidiomarina taiwanensis]